MASTEASPSGSDRIRVAIAQVESPDDEPVDERRRRVESIVGALAGADLIALPELWDIGFMAFDRYEAAATALESSPTVQAARTWAADAGSWLLMGSIVERTGAGACHNTTVLLEPTGRIAYTSRKRYVFGYQSLEAQLLRPGEESTVHGDAFGGLASTTCYDLRFPELYRCLVGARLVAVPAAWPAARIAHWQTLIRARAIENQFFLIAANAAGPQRGVPMGGHSAVISPRGETLLELGGGEDSGTVEIDLGEVDAWRAEFPALRDRQRSVLAEQLRAFDAASGLAERVEITP